MIDLSCDLGEATDAEGFGVEARIWPQITSANIACGGHVGDDESMRRSVRAALARGIAIGAHPSYPDRANFGRKSMTVPPEELRRTLREQLGHLARIAAEEGGALEHMKPHGALYNDAYADAQLALIVVNVAKEFGIAVVTSSGSALERAARDNDCAIILEGFADRRYRADGSLHPRSLPDSLLLDVSETAEQAARLAAGIPVDTAEGQQIVVPCSTICIHSDMPGAPERLTAIRERLTGTAVRGGGA